MQQIQQALTSDGRGSVDDKQKMLHIWRKLQRTENALREALQEVGNAFLQRDS